MLSKRTLFVLLLASILGASLQAELKLEYQDYKKFTDLDFIDRSQKTGLKIFNKEVGRLKSLNELAANKGSLLIRFKDVDMAGEILPVGRSFEEARQITSARPPKLKFDYAFIDADGSVSQQGSETLLSLDFQYTLKRASSSSPFFYELTLLDEWAKSF